MSEKAVRLEGGDLNAVVRIGQTVRRPTGPRTPALHALLRHLESVGFDGAPPVRGIDDEGREILEYVEGEPGQAPVPADDGALVELGRLLRRTHDAQKGFVPPPTAAPARFVGRALACRRGGYDLHGRLGRGDRRAGWRQMWDCASGETILANAPLIEKLRPTLAKALR